MFNANYSYRFHPVFSSSLFLKCDLRKYIFFKSRQNFRLVLTFFHYLTFPFNSLLQRCESSVEQTGHSALCSLWTKGWWEAWVLLVKQQEEKKFASTGPSTTEDRTTQMAFILLREQGGLLNEPVKWAAQENRCCHHKTRAHSASQQPKCTRQTKNCRNLNLSHNFQLFASCLLKSKIQDSWFFSIYY